MCAFTFINSVYIYWLLYVNKNIRYKKQNIVVYISYITINSILAVIYVNKQVSETELRDVTTRSSY